MPDNINKPSSDNHSNSKLFHKYKNDNTSAVDRKVNSRHHSTSCLHNHRQADVNDFHNYEISYFDNRNIVESRQKGNIDGKTLDVCHNNHV